MFLLAEELAPDAPATPNVTRRSLLVTPNVLPMLLWLLVRLLEVMLHPLTRTDGATLGAWAYMTPDRNLPLPNRLANRPLMCLDIPRCPYRTHVC